MNLLRCFAIFSLLFAVSVYAQDWEQFSENEERLQPTADYPDAVILFDRGLVTTEQSGVTFDRHTRLKVFTPAGAVQAGEATIEYLHYDHLTDIEMRLHRQGITSKLSAKDHSQTVEKGPWRYCVLQFSDLQPGDIIEYRYTIEYYSGFDKLGPEAFYLFGQEHYYDAYKFKTRIEGDIDHFGEGIVMRNLPSWHFDNPIYCLTSEFTAKIGADCDYLFVPLNMPAERADPAVERVKVLTATAYKKHTWHMENIRAFPSDSSAQGFSELNRSGLHFNRFSSVDRGENRIIRGVYDSTHWQYVGRSIQGYLNEYLKVTIGMRKQFGKLWSSDDAPMVRIVKICDYLTSQYTADSGGYNMHPAHDDLRKLYKTRHGVPFEINLLMVKMLESAGVKAWPVLISTRDKLPFQLSGLFNHMLVMTEVEGRCVFLDASSDDGSCENLPWECKVPFGVCVDFDKSRVVDMNIE